MQESQIRSLVGEDPLGKEMATYSSILARLHSIFLARILEWVAMPSSRGTS